LKSLIVGKFKELLSFVIIAIIPAAEEENQDLMIIDFVIWILIFLFKRFFKTNTNYALSLNYMKFPKLLFSPPLPTFPSQFYLRN